MGTHDFIYCSKSYTYMASMSYRTTDFYLSMYQHTLKMGPVALMNSQYHNNHVTHQHKQQSQPIYRSATIADER